MKRKLGNDEIDMIVLRILHSIGFSYTTYGFKCLRDVIIMVMNDKTSPPNMVDPKFYHDISKRYNTDRGSVTMAIRNSMLMAWERCGRERYAEARSNLIKYGFDPSVIPMRDDFVLRVAYIVKSKVEVLESVEDTECKV